MGLEKLLSGVKVAVGDFCYGARDSVTGVVTPLLFNLVEHKLNKFGNMTSLQVDSKNKTMRLELELKGEATPIVVNITRYHLSEKAGKSYLRMEGVQTSREWINLVMEEYLTRLELEVPKVLKIAL